MSVPTIPSFVRDDLDRLDIDLSDQVLTRLCGFLDLLLEANRRFNLTSIRERDKAWRRHIIDSLTLLPFLAPEPADAALIDVGSGGGVPGIPLAIARPDWRVALLEATGKKARFLHACVTELGIEGCRVVHDRAEAAGQDPAHRQRYDAAVCRAIGPMREMLEYALPLVRVGGRSLAMKGSKAEQELKDADRALELLGAGNLEVYDAYGKGFDSQSVIVIITKARPTPSRYPRPPGMPRKSPL